jgi:hypothetical protein
MTGEQTLLARGALGLAGSLASVGLASVDRLRTLTNELFDRLVVGALVCSRLGLFALVFLVLHLQVRGDIPGFYWPEALAVLRGGLPYRNFISSYAPLHAYIDAAAIRIWYSPLAIILMAILAECLLLPVWLWVGRRIFPEQELRVAALFYLASPMSLVFVTTDGQDNVIIALLIAAAMALLIRRSEGLSGASAALAMAAIKILALLFMPIFFLATPRRWRWAAGAAVVTAAVYGTAAVVFHLPIVQPLTVEGGFRGSGNLPYILESATGRHFPARLLDSLVLLGLCAVLLYVARAVYRQTGTARLLVITFAMPAIIATLLLLSKKCWPNYLMLVLFPVCLLARRMRGVRLVTFALFGTVAVLEHSYWASLLGLIDSAHYHALLFQRRPFGGGELLLLGHALLQLLLITGYGWILILCLREVAAASQLPELAKGRALRSRSGAAAGAG